MQEATQRLCVQLADRLQHRLRAAGSLTLEVERLGEGLRAQWVSQAVTLSRPSRDGRHLWALLRPHVERLHLGHGVEALTLTARQAPRAGLTQLGPAEAQVESQQLAAAEAQLVDVLSARLGAHRVTRPTPVPTHVPEAAVRWVPAVEMPSPGERIDPSDPAWCGEEALEGSVTSGGRPSWLLDPVEPAQVLLLHPEGPVLSLDWRGHTRKLITSVGPERIAPRWWKSHARRVEDPARASRVPRGNGPPRPPQPRPRHRQVGAPAVGAGHDEATEPDEPLPPLWSDLAARDYYRVQEESGLWLWVFRRLDTGRWFVHGLWL